MTGGPVLTLIAPVKDEEEAIGPFIARVTPLIIFALNRRWVFA